MNCRNLLKCTSRSFIYLFACDFSRCAIIAQPDEPWMPEASLLSPFEKLNRRYQSRPEPAAALHVFGGQPLTPSALSRFGKIVKRAFGDRQTLELREYGPTRCWRESVPNS